MKNTKKFLLGSTAVLMSVGLVACSTNSASLHKPAATLASKSYNAPGTYKCVKGKDKHALKLNTDGSGRKADNTKKDGKTDNQITWKKKSKNVFNIKVKNSKNKFTAKFDKSGNLSLSNEKTHENIVYKKVKKLNINRFIGASQDSDDDVFAPAKKNNSTSSAQSSRVQKSSDIPGDDGLFNMPTDMQGTWYSVSKDDDDNKLTTLTIDKNRISYQSDSSDENGGSILHKMQNNFDFEKYIQDQDYMQKTQNWGRVTQQNVDGHSMINVRGWTQGAGDGSYYYLVQEKGQTVLIEGAGAGVWTMAVYWRNKNDALANADTKFDNLHYSDDGSADD